MTYQSEASTELYSGASPVSGKRFGSMPCETVPAQAMRMSRASVQPARGQAKAAHGDERVAAPIAEPRIARDDRLAGAALDQISVAARRRGVGKAARRTFPSPASLSASSTGGRRRRPVAESFGGKNQDGRTRRRDQNRNGPARPDLPPHRVRARVPRHRENSGTSSGS